jgi:hypothetical protein
MFPPAAFAMANMKARSIANPCVFLQIEQASVRRLPKLYLLIDSVDHPNGLQFPTTTSSTLL